ncbi:MAG TPA: glucose 1-dehydrogenase [Terriglobia bacterium]|nr:glucose 1-dehydrogenase [Terriglobia bacterium]
MRLQNRIAVITGAASGIGAATAIRFAEEGAAVCLADVDSEGGQAVARKIEAAKGKVMFREVDVSNETQVKGLMDSVVQEFGGLDILVNNAAVFLYGTVETTTAEDWDRILGVNVKGYAFCAKHAVPHIRRRGGGAIVNVGSVSSFIAQPQFVPYSTTKGAIMQLTRCMAYDHAPDHIRVNCVCPGAIDTPATLRHARSVGKSKEQIVEDLKSVHLIKRLGEPREIANAILFAASDEASFMTGSALMVDGGWSAP